MRVVVGLVVEGLVIVGDVPHHLVVVVGPAMVRVVGVVEGFEEPEKCLRDETKIRMERKLPEEEKSGGWQEREAKYEDERPHGCSITASFPALAAAL